MTRSIKLSQRHTFAINTHIKLRVFARYDSLVQIKARVAVYKLGMEL